MLGWVWDLLVSFFTFVIGLLGLKKKSVSFADETSGEKDAKGVVESAEVAVTKEENTVVSS